MRSGAKKPREQGKDGMYEMPDGRLVFEPWLGGKGYVVETASQERRIRRAAQLVPMVAAVPIAIVLAAPGGITALVAFALLIAAEIALWRWMVRDLVRRAAPMTLLARLRLRAAAVSTGGALAGAVFCGVLAVAGVRAAIASLDPMMGFGVAWFAFLCFCAAYMWHVRRSTRI